MAPVLLSGVTSSHTLLAKPASGPVRLVTYRHGSMKRAAHVLCRSLHDRHSNIFKVAAELRLQVLDQVPTVHRLVLVRNLLALRIVNARQRLNKPQDTMISLRMCCHIVLLLLQRGSDWMHAQLSSAAFVLP